MNGIHGDLGKLLGGDFVPVILPDTAIGSSEGGRVSDHILNTAKHVTPTQAAQIAGAATAISLSNEIQARIAGDAQSSQDIENERLRATTAEQRLRSDIEDEEERARTAEETLQGNINAEAGIRQTAVTQLQTAIDAEKTRAQGAEATLAANLVTEISTRQTSDATETTNRQNADNDLQTQLDAMQGQTRRFFLNFADVFGTATPTKAMADAWLAARTPALTPEVGIAFKNNNTSQSTYNHLFVYYSDSENTGGLILSDDGVDTVSTASAASLGIVRGAGDVSVDLNGDLRLNANTVTDAVVGSRTLVDNAGNATLVPTTAKNLTAWLQGIRDNLKALLSYFTNGVANSAAKLDTTRNISIGGKVTGTATGFNGEQDITINVTALSSAAADYPVLNQSTTGNAATATKLAASVNLNVGGDVSGTAQAFNGSAAITIPVTLNANVGTDSVIGNRTLTDAAADATLVAITAKSLTAWLQGIRNNLKALFANKQDKTVSAAVISALGLTAGATVEDALISIANKRKNSFYISEFKTF